jgi:uncharacterized Tic20 family protein
MAKKDETPETKQDSGGEASAEQGATGAQPADIQQGPSAMEENKDARMWAMICHLAGLAMFIPIVPIIGNVIGPLIFWQIKKNEHPFVDEQGKEAVNFQISMLIYGIAAGLLIFACVGVVLVPAVVIVDVVFLLIAAVKANNGEHYRYPLTIRFIK